MFRSQRDKQNSLHIVLQKNSCGLSLGEISDLLKIKDTECIKILAREIERGTVDFNYDEDSFPLYFSNKKVSVNTIYNQKIWVKYFLIIGITLILFSLFLLIGFRDTVPESFDISELTRERIASTTLARYKSQRSNLEKRVELMESERSRCNQKWSVSETCYVTKRLLNEKEFEKELAEMKTKINKLDKLIILN